MFDPKWIRDHPELLDRALARRGLSPLASTLIELDEKRRELIAAVQTLQERRNVASREIGEAKRARDEARVQALMAEVAGIKDELPKLEAAQREAEEKLNAALAEIPNVPADDVPDGDASANAERHKFGEAPKFGFRPKQHFDLGEALGLMDFETAAKLSGARFVVLKGALARLERALAQFFLDVHTGEFGYTEVAPPLLVRDDVMFGTAQLPKFADDQFSTSIGARPERYPAEVIAATLSDLDAPEKLNVGRFKSIAAHHVSAAERELRSSRLWLIPTAEVPLTNLVREMIVDEAELPLRLTACTPCFRAEAGAAGKDTRGMLRQHQFTKVELVSVTTPEQSEEEHERMLACAETVLKRIGLHYRVVTLSTGDMGFAAAKTYDIEVWLPGQNAFREISSCSNCGEFQARRMQARYRSKSSRQIRHVHTLNGSGVAVGRALIAVMETFQQADGSIHVPDVLRPYMGGLAKIEKVN